MHHHRMASDDRHGYGQLTRFLDPAALAECEAVDATPPEPVLPAIGPLAATIDAALDSLFGPASAHRAERPGLTPGALSRGGRAPARPPPPPRAPGPPRSRSPPPRP